MPLRDSADLSPSLLSPTGDTGTWDPAPPKTPLQTQEPGPPASLLPGTWALVIHGSVFTGSSHGIRPSPFLSQDSAKQKNPISLSSEEQDCLASGLPAPPGSPHPESQALKSLGHRNLGPQPLPSKGPVPDQLRTSQPSLIPVSKSLWPQALLLPGIHSSGLQPPNSLPP